MAKTITRQTLKLFGSSGGSTNFAEFGSQAAGSPVKTKSIPTIQALTAYSAGWQSAVALGQAPYLEDMNSLFYLLAYEQCYALQEGIPEWDAGTTYFVGSVVRRVGSWEIYTSQNDDNLNHALPSQADDGNWFYCGIMQHGCFVPVGSMFDFAGASAALPAGYLICDGSAISRSTYSGLFAVLGTAWGVGNGSTTFNLPDFRRRVAVGSGGSGSGVLGNAVGNTGGEETHTQSVAELPVHHHVETGNNGVVGALTVPATVTNASGASATAANTGDTGSGTPFNVIQPSAVVTKIIKY